MILGRDNNLDAMRLALATLVIFSHSYMFASGHHPSDPLSRYTRGDEDFGSLAVSCFFSISGYLVAMSYERDERPRAFMRRRAARILPGYFAAFAVSVLVVSPLTSRPMTAAFAPAELARAAGYGISLGAWTSSTAFAGNPMPGIVNGSLWTIHYEFGCYLLLAALGALGLLRGRTRLLAASWLGLLAIAFCSATAKTGLKVPTLVATAIGDPEIWAKLLSFFFAGTLLYRFANRVPRGPPPATVAALALGAGLLTPTLGAVVLPAAVTYLLFWLATAPTSRLHRIKRIVGGDYSYGTYLYGAPIQQLVAWALVGTRSAHSPLVQFAISVPLAIAAGAASWHLIERRFLPLGADRSTRAIPPARERP